MFLIREAQRIDLPALLALYSYLHREEAPTPERAEKAWCAIESDPNHHILLGEADGQAVSTCVLVVLPNLTRNSRPYGLIENMVTHPDYRGRHYATALLGEAAALARRMDCYKLMLLTGRKDAATLRFYRNAGFNAEDKTAFIQWLS